MVLIQSYYTVASIYYFSRNYEFAYEVVTEGKYYNTDIYFISIVN